MIIWALSQVQSGRGFRLTAHLSGELDQEWVELYLHSPTSCGQFYLQLIPQNWLLHEKLAFLQQAKFTYCILSLPFVQGCTIYAWPEPE